MQHDGTTKSTTMDYREGGRGTSMFFFVFVLTGICLVSVSLTEVKKGKFKLEDVFV